MAKPCPSRLTAPFRGEDAEHQCSDNDDHRHNHWCGCGYEWKDGQRIVKHPDTPTEEK